MSNAPQQDPYYASRPTLGSAEPRSQPGRVLRTPTLQEVDLHALPETQPFRPQRRPPVALLCILDDGRSDGEWLRLRGDRFVIGRSEGDLHIPHDPLVSSRHVELTRHPKGDAWVWHLTDLGSTNGTFARITRAVLEPGQEFLIGAGRYRFDSPLDRGSGAHSGDVEGDEQQMTTWRWQGGQAKNMIPTLTELLDDDTGRSFDLLKSENWVGRDRRLCAVTLDDPLVNPQHACLTRDQKGRWTVEDGRTLNGTWVRIQNLKVKSSAQFQVGEQRFLLRVSG